MIACAGHWFLGGLYFSPLVLIGGLVWVQTSREKRADRKRDRSAEAAAPAAAPQT